MAVVSSRPHSGTNDSLLAAARSVAFAVDDGSTSSAGGEPAANAALETMATSGSGGPRPSGVVKFKAATPCHAETDSYHSSYKSGTRPSSIEE